MPTCRSSAFDAARRRALVAILLAGLLAAAVFTGAAAAAGSSEILTPAAALSQAEAGDITLIDVRSPGEWQATGVPQGARQVTIHDPQGLQGFVRAVLAEVEGDLDRPIAVICARGNRSTIAHDVLTSAGFTAVYNVREGMLGSADGPGWLSRAMPTEACRRC